MDDSIIYGRIENMTGLGQPVRNAENPERHYKRSEMNMIVSSFYIQKPAFVLNIHKSVTKKDFNFKK